MHCINVDTISYAGKKKYRGRCGTTLNMDLNDLWSITKSIVCPIVNTNKNRDDQLPNGKMENIY